MIQSDNKPRFVICCGMRRSGSTLQYNLARSILETQKSGVEVLGYVNGNDLQDRVVDLESNAGKTYLLKSHDVVQCRSLASCNVLLLYTFRDFRDVYVSGKIKLGWTRENLEELALELNSSFVAANSCERILIQKYEDLFANKVIGTRKIASFLDAMLSEKEVLEIANENETKISNSIVRQSYLKVRGLARNLASTSNAVSILFEPLRKLNQLFFQRFGIDPKTQIHLDHISRNKGCPGAWKDELSARELDEINSKYAELLKSMGYHVGE